MLNVDLMLGLSGLPGSELIRLAKLADQTSVRTIWVPEVTFGDAFLMATAVAANTDRLKVGTGVVGIYSRSPVVMGMQIYSVNEFFPGRGWLGLGTQAPGYVQNWHGVPYERFLTRMREYIHCVRKIVACERVAFEGKTLRVRNFQLMKPPLTEQPRIYVGAISPQMIQIAGELADGLFGNFYSADAIRATVIPNLEIGARRANRSLENFDIGSAYPTVVSSAGDAVELVKPHVMMYASGAATTRAYADMVHQAGFTKEVQVIADAIQRSDMKAAVNAVTERMCRTFTICGTPDEMRDRIAELQQAGLTSVMLNTLPPGTYFRLNEKHFPSDVEDQTIEMSRYVRYIEAIIAAVA